MDVNSKSEMYGEGKMGYLQSKHVIAIATALAVGLAAKPAVVKAAGFENLLQSVGVASIFEVDLSEEEYMAIADAAEGSHWGYTDLGIANTPASYLNVRETPSTSAKLVGRMWDRSACEILEISDGWAKITSGEVEGYVCCDYLLMGLDAIIEAKGQERTVAVSQGDALNVRVEPSLKGSILTTLSKGEELEYVESLEDWIHVKLDDVDAYVYGEYVTVEKRLDTALTMSEVLYGKNVSDFRAELVEYAKQFVGNPYVWGGTSLTKGADCSGFVQSVFKNFGIKLDRTSRAQAKNGTAVSESELQPGDLVFYSKNGTINHVALYIGGGQIVHASNQKDGIKISNYNYRTPACCRRVITE